MLLLLRNVVKYGERISFYIYRVNGVFEASYCLLTAAAAESTAAASAQAAADGQNGKHDTTEQKVVIPASIKKRQK